MKRVVLYFSIVSMTGFLLHCSEESSDAVNEDNTVVICQIGGCAKHPASFYSPDSCLSYRFSDTLLVEFCLAGNCCPDSDRFLITTRISGDTIFVVAADTSGSNCYCECTYIIQARFTGLQLPRYVFHCLRADKCNVLCYDALLSRNGL